MLYAIISEDVENSLELRLSVRPAHVERLVSLKESGKLILAGPNPAIDSEDPGTNGFTGSLIVAEKITTSCFCICTYVCWGKRFFFTCG